MSRTIIIGDLHGMYDEAVALLRACNVTPKDRVIWLGDFVDRGPENAKCVDLVREREQIQGSIAGILGNHEERHLEYEDMLARGKALPDPLHPNHAATRAQLKPEHYAWFRTLPLFVRVPEHNVAAVHAGCFPGRSLEEQSPTHLLHIQMINPAATERSLWPSKVPAAEHDDWRFWTHFWDGPERIVFGHSVLDRPLITDKVVGIDGGAVFGRQLHAYVLPEGRIVTVDGSRDFGKGRRGTQARSILTFNVHGNVCTYS